MSAIPKPDPAVVAKDTAKPTEYSKKRDQFGDVNPWAEPAWYNVLSSPYYNESHRKLRNFVRMYIDENVLPYAEEWEEEGLVPLDIR